MFILCTKYMIYVLVYFGTVSYVCHVFIVAETSYKEAQNTAFSNPPEIRVRILCAMERWFTEFVRILNLKTKLYSLFYRLCANDLNSAQHSFE